MPEIKPHEYTTSVMVVKCQYHKCHIAPDTMFLSYFYTGSNERTVKIYFLKHCAN